MEQSNYVYYIPFEVRTIQSGYDNLAALFCTINGQNTKEVLVDFTRCNHFDGNLASAMGALLDRLVDEGYSVWINRPLAKNVRRVLSRNHFLRNWSIETQVEDRENFIYYKKFPKDNPQLFKQYIDTYLIHKQRFPNHTESAGQKILESIYEIYANATMHGHTDFVYSCGEYDENTAMLDMTIVDCGVTIKRNVNDFLKKRNLTPLSSVESILWAFEDGNTTKDAPGGLGLALLKSFIKSNGGILQVVSDTGMIEYNNSKTVQFLLSKPFPGTIVNMKFNFNDKKKYYSKEEYIDINKLL